MFGKIKRAAVSMLLFMSIAIIPSITGECHDLPESSYTQIAGTMMKVSSGISDQAKTDSLIAWTSLPFNIQSILIQNNIWIYELNPNNDQLALSDYYTGQSHDAISVFPSYNLRTYSDGRQEISQTSSGYIDIFSNNASKRGECTLTILHEIGHQVDCLYLGGYTNTRSWASASDQSAWQYAYAKEKINLSLLDKDSSVNTYDSSESFAEAFGMYFYNNARLKAKCPAMYAYVQTVVGSF